MNISLNLFVNIDDLYYVDYLALSYCKYLAYKWVKDDCKEDSLN